MHYDNSTFNFLCFIIMWLYKNQYSNTIHVLGTCLCINLPWWTCCIHVAGHIYLIFPCTCIIVDLIISVICFLTDTKKNYLMALSHCLQSLPQSVLLRELPQVSLYLASHKDTYSIKHLTEKKKIEYTVIQFTHKQVSIYSRTHSSL